MSFRTTHDERARLKRLASERGVSLQRLMRDLVAERMGCVLVRKLGNIVATLRDRKADLSAKGVERMWVFGSVARGDEKPGSDVDLLVEIAAGARMSLTGFARLKADIEGILGGPVDLAEWRTLESRIRKSAERDAVAVF